MTTWSWPRRSRSGGAKISGRASWCAGERAARQTPYPRIVGRCQALLHAAPLASHMTSLVLDATMVGTGVVDLFRQGDLPSPVLVSITGGDQVHTDRDLCRVPRRDLVGA